jgi:hypothetical protein
MSSVLSATNQATDQAVVKHPPLLNDVSLQKDDLTEEAKSQFSYHTDISHAFELCRRSVLDNELLSPIGRHLLFSEINQLYIKSKQVLNYMAAHDELLHNSLPKFGPLIVCSLPRTGSTLLHNLLACDPNCRTTLITDMVTDPVPPIPRSNLAEHKRRAVKRILAKQATEQLVGRSSALTGSHPTFPIEQDFYIIQQAGIIPRWAYLCSPHQTELVDFIYDNTNKTFAYDYHETFIRMLNSSDAPCSHWMWKSVSHIFYIDTMLRHYPNTALIMTHRRLDELLPSLCRLAWEFVSFYLDQSDSTSRAIVTKRAVQQFDIMIERIMDFRTRPNNLKTTVFDVMYDQLTEQPIATVRRIYEHFGLAWSQEFEAAMSVWLQDNPQGKQGRNTYSLTEYGLTHEDIEQRYASYISMFLRSSVLSQPIETNTTEKPS